MDVNFFSKACDVLLEVEINESGALRFENEYLEITGVAPRIGIGYQYQSNKWGREFRVYFNADLDIIDELVDKDVHVESGDRPYRSSRTYRINNRDFFWSLVNSGYRLGEN
ncbi:hypothetical protein [Marinobacter psychrophilus]|jgi:hypothetical protein|uniref:hypothetical protein n=1 Tax=Marinobacter psychrophilus TaxID=330734 RepID=UPI001B3ED4FE|nr:hypothetical protein [Marinobacter psychrophilus]MBQ0762092.1 hypothetical protein [Marinobacter psychrophilus]MBQ0843666.1 hypothetical protein [Marinobacter psychrophilus]